MLFSVCLQGPFELWRRQVEGSDDENSHLPTCDRVVGAVQQGRSTASAGDALIVQLLDPWCGPMAGRRIIKYTYSSWWGVAGTIFGTEQEDSHLGSGDRVAGAVQHW